MGTCFDIATYLGLLWKWVFAAYGEVLDQAGHKSPKQAPRPPRLRLRKYIWGELNTSTVLDALREKSMGVSVWGCLKQNIVSRRQRKREKVTDGPEPRVCKAGHERNNC